MKRHSVVPWAVAVVATALGGCERGPGDRGAQTAAERDRAEFERLVERGAPRQLHPALPPPRDWEVAERPVATPEEIERVRKIIESVTVEDVQAVESVRIAGHRYPMAWLAPDEH